MLVIATLAQRLDLNKTVDKAFISVFSPSFLMLVAIPIATSAHYACHSNDATMIWRVVVGLLVE